MAIITKPVGGILKGVPASISLSKSELSALSIIVADSYFSNTSNWNKVILKYRSSTGKQYETVQFDATLSSPTGNFLVSIKARDAFEIQAIEIHDFDNDIFIVPRSALNVADFDVVLLSAPSSLSYSTPVTYTQNTAITNNVPTVTGTVTSYFILPALPAGLSLNTTTGVISGTPTEVSAAANYVVTASNEAGSTTATINITVVESMEEFDIVNFTGRNNPTYISFPAPGSVTRLLPAVNLENNGQGSFWSTTPLSGDFTFTATVKAGSVSDGPVQALFGLNDVMPPPSNSGYGLKAAGWGLNFYNDGSVVRPWDVGVDTLAYTKGSTYNIEIKRVSGVVSYKVNSTTFPYTLSTSATVYLVGYLQVGSWEVTNAQLAAEEFTGGPIPWNNTSSGYLIELDGGVTTTAQRPSGPIFDIVYGSSNSYVTGDFIYEAEISTSLQSDSIVGFYDSVGGPYNTIVKGGATTLSFWLTNEWNNGTPEYTMAKPSGDTFLFKITRVGTLVKLFVNNVEIASETTTVSHLLVPFFTLRPNDYIVDAQITFEEVPVGDPIIWDTFLNGAIAEADGGISGGTSGAIVKSNASKAENGADFKFTFNFTMVPGGPHSNLLKGIMPSTANTGFVGWTGITFQSSTDILIYDNYSGSGAEQATFSNSMMNQNGANTAIFEKIGNVLTIKMNDVTIYTKNNYTEQTSVPMVRLWGGLQVLDSAYAEIQEAVVGDPILWQSKPGYIIEADGGATATSERPNYSDNIGGPEYYRVFAPSSQWVTGDFTFEAEINNAWGSPDFIGFYDSDTNFTVTTGFNGSQVWYGQSAPANYVKPAGDTYTLKMQRTGYVLKFYVNDVEVYSVTQTNLSTVKVPFFTFTDSAKHIVSATLLLPTATDYINWDLLTGYQAGSLTITPTSGVSGGISLAGDDVAVKSDADKATGDFDYTFKFDWSSASSVNNMFAGVTGNNVTSGTSPLFYDRLTCIYGNGNNPDTANLWHNGSSVGGTTQTLLSGVNTYRLKRVGTTITHYLNDVQIYSATSTSFTAYPSVRTMGNSVVTESYITQAPISVTWNVAGKTGIGTVTTGANGLITKATGGNSYNVNVLSNETITGDGYIEFIYSSIFLNVVFGVAEINSASGSYDQIIYGTYVAGLGLYERVVAGQALGNIGVSVVSGDIIRIQRTGNTFSILRNGSVINTETINNTNPLKASVSIFGESYGINNTTLSE